MLTLSLVAAALVSQAPAAHPGPRAGPSFEGYTGLFAVPNARTTPEGAAELLYTARPLPGFEAGAAGAKTFALSLGLFGFAEVSARVSEVTDDPAVPPRTSMRDLSLNLKLQAPLHLLDRRLPAIAVGTQDEGGAAPHFRTRYLVMSQELWRFRGTVGYGTGPDRLSGLFGGLEAALHEGVTLMVDHDGQQARAGARLSVPIEVAGVRAHVGALAAMKVGDAFGVPEIAVSVSTPLDWSRDPPLPWRGSPPVAGGEGETIGLEALQAALIEGGFENVRVGVKAGTLVVEYENEVFNWSEADGVDVVLGTVARHVPPGLSTVVLHVLEQGVRTLELVTGLGPQGAPLREGVRRRVAPPPVEGVAWLAPTPRNPSRLHARLVLGPGVRTFLATELGLLDYVLSVRPELTVPLWRGAAAYARWDIPVAWSRNLAEGGPLAAYRGGPQLDHALLYQGGRLAPGVLGLVGAGLLRRVNAAVLGEVWWVPGAGVHQLGVQASLMRTPSGAVRASAVGTYRAWVPGAHAFLALRAGQFFAGDRGASIEVGRAFGDTLVSVFATRTERTVIGGAVSLPLTPRRDLRPDWLQVRGSPRWRYLQSTVIRETTNPLVGGLGVLPATGYSLDEAWLDRGRLGSN